MPRHTRPHSLQSEGIGYPPDPRRGVEGLSCGSIPCRLVGRLYAAVVVVVVVVFGLEGGVLLEELVFV